MPLDALLLSLQLENSKVQELNLASFNPTIIQIAVKQEFKDNFDLDYFNYDNYLNSQNNLKNLKAETKEASKAEIAAIKKEQDQIIQRIVDVTVEYGNDDTVDRLAEQAERLNRFAGKLNGTPDQIFNNLTGIYITNSAEWGSIVGQRDPGAFSNPEALTPEQVIFGKNTNISRLSKAQREGLIARFKPKFLALRERLQKVIDSGAGKQLSLRGLLANYLAVGGVFPGEGVPSGGEEARESTTERVGETARKETPREIEGEGENARGRNIEELSGCAFLPSSVQDVADARIKEGGKKTDKENEGLIARNCGEIWNYANHNELGRQDIAKAIDYLNHTGRLKVQKLRLTGGRSGANVEGLSLERNSIYPSTSREYIYITDEAGKILLDIKKGVKGRIKIYFRFIKPDGSIINQDVKYPDYNDATKEFIPDADVVRVIDQVNNQN